MATIPREFVADLTARVSIIEVLSPFVDLKKAGREYKACCPFHKEKTPSFTVSVEKNFYHCFGCQKSGDALQFLMDYNKYTYVEAITELAKQQGLLVPTVDDGKPRENLQPYYELNELAASFYQQQLQSHPMAKKAQQYCKKRGINFDIVQQYGIGYAPPGWDNLLNHAVGHQFTHALCVKAGLTIEKSEGKYYDRFRNRIMFPIRDQRGRVIGFGGRAIDAEDNPKYLNSPETPLFHKGNELYGLWEAGRSQSKQGLILVEGYMDVVALAQYGIPGPVATLGTATTEEHLQKCFRFNNHVYFCFDGDAAGKKAAWRALEIVLRQLKDNHTVHFLFLPQNEDPDTFVRKLGADAFLARLEHATPLADFFYAHLSEDLDLKHLDQRAQLANRASPLIQRIPDPILKELMFTTLSQLVQLPLAVLKDISDKQTASIAANQPTIASTPRRTIAPAERQTSLQKLPSPMRIAVSLLVQNPELANDTPDMSRLAQSSLPGAALFIRLMTFIREHQITTSADLLSQWTDTESHHHLEKCSQYRHTIPAAGLIEEYTGAIARLHEHHYRIEVEQYLKKAQQHGLSDEEKHELHRLLTCLSTAEGTK